MVNLVTYQQQTFLIHTEFEKLGVKHVFTTKPQAMGIFRNSDLEDLTQSYSTIKDYLGIQGHYYFMHQIHSNKVIDINQTPLEKHSLGFYYDGCDGLITTQPNQLLISTYADCIPLCVFDSQQKILANCHSGWRSTLSGILDKTLDAFIHHYHSNPKDIHVLSGPHLLVDDFEVKDDVAQLFQEQFPTIKNLICEQGFRKTINLNFVNQYYCDQHQIPLNQVHFIDISTLHHELMHSYRKDKENFQQMALITCFSDKEVKQFSN